MASAEAPVLAPSVATVHAAYTNWKHVQELCIGVREEGDMVTVETPILENGCDLRFRCTKVQFVQLAITKFMMVTDDDGCGTEIEVRINMNHGMISAKWLTALGCLHMGSTPLTLRFKETLQAALDYVSSLQPEVTERYALAKAKMDVYKGAQARFAEAQAAEATALAGADADAIDHTARVRVARGIDVQMARKAAGEWILMDPHAVVA